MLYTKEKCPYCHFIFIGGYDPDNIRKCPSCERKFVSGNYEGTNNIHYKNGCPALMSDGRFLTYYNSSHELTEIIRRLQGVCSTNKFRTLMQNNPHIFMEIENSYTKKECPCYPTIGCSEGWIKSQVC